MVVDSVAVDSSDVTVVDDAAVVGGVLEALDSVAGGTGAVVLSVAGGAPEVLVSVDGGADEPGGALVDSGGVAEDSDAGGAGVAEALLSVAGGTEDSVEAGGGVGVFDSTPDVDGPDAGTEVETGGAPVLGGAPAEEEGAGIAEVSVEEHWLTVIVTVVVEIIPKRHKGQSSPSCGCQSSRCLPGAISRLNSPKGMATPSSALRIITADDSVSGSSEGCLWKGSLPLPDTGKTRRPMVARKLPTKRRNCMLNEMRVISW